jgi:tyrosyl-tRNA synthetase
MSEIPVQLSLTSVCGHYIHLDRLLVAIGLASSRSEAQRKIEEGAVWVDGEREEDFLCVVTYDSFQNGTEIRLGKRMKKVVWGDMKEIDRKLQEFLKRGPR